MKSQYSPVFSHRIVVQASSRRRLLVRSFYGKWLIFHFLGPKILFHFVFGSSSTGETGKPPPLAPPVHGGRISASLDLRIDADAIERRVDMGILLPPRGRGGLERGSSIAKPRCSDFEMSLLFGEEPDKREPLEIERVRCDS